MRKKKKYDLMICDLNVVLTSQSILIEESWTIFSSKQMRVFLNTLREYVEEADIPLDTPLNHRSNWSMVREWIYNNNLYALGYKMDDTGSVTFTYPKKWYEKLNYFFGSIFAI